MGLLTLGKPFSPEETRKASSYIREHGIIQFLNTWRRVKDISNDELKFGDEVEVGIFIIDPTTKSIKINVRSAEIRSELSARENKYASELEGCTWHPEFGGWMVESTPSRPYSNFVTDLLRVERNMILRRRRLLSALLENEIAPTVTCFPLMGTNDFIHNPSEFSSKDSLSEFVPDYAINPHPRFAALTRNIRHRREQKVDIRAPLFVDTRTPADETEIKMDCMAFGMGMCCLQVTFQARDVDESRYMYDQLAVLAPIMLALTAGTPFLMGKISDTDVRWKYIAQSVDDRTPAERGRIDEADIDKMRVPEMAGDGVRRIPKSRYDSVSTYIYHCAGSPDCERTFLEYNDVDCPIDEVVKKKLLDEGLDENLAHHIAHLFIRDPLVVYEEGIELDDEKHTDHFENIQSTNWQTCRWKPPPPRLTAEDPHIGWRTEFRSMEVQLTDFENAAFTVFICLITRVVLAFDLAFYIPLSKVDENMSRAHQRDASRGQKFYFRKHLAPIEELIASSNAKISPSNSHADFSNPILRDVPNVEQSSSLSSSLSSSSSSSSAAAAGVCSGGGGGGPSCISACQDDSSQCFEEMTMGEIFNGKGDYFPGLIPLVYAYLDFINCEPLVFSRLDMYMKFISKRATGELLTPATWMRNFVANHPSYKQDSNLTSDIVYDLMIECKNIGEGISHCPDILGAVRIDKVCKEDAYNQTLPGRLNQEQKSQLIKRLVARAEIPRHPKLDIVPRGFSSPSKPSVRKHASTDASNGGSRDES